MKKANQKTNKFFKKKNKNQKTEVNYCKYTTGCLVKSDNTEHF